MRLRAWDPQGLPTAAVLVVHGWGMHASPYDRLCSSLAEGGARAIAIDLPGHGPDSAPKEFTLGASLTALRIGLEYCRNSSASSLSVIAESAGADVVLNLGPEIATTRLAFLAPGVLPRLRQLISPRALWDVLKLIFVGRIRLDGWRLESISTNPEFLAERRADPWTRLHASRRYVLTVVMAGLRGIIGGAPRLRGEVRIWHGSEDRLLAPVGSRLLLLLIRSRTKSLRIIEGAEHGLIWDATFGPSVIEEVTDWVLG